MTWLQRYRIRHYLSNSIWVWPLMGMVLALVVARWILAVEEFQGWRSGVDPSRAQAVLGTMASSMFTFIIFVSSALLVAVQLASAQLTPRIIATVFRDPVTKVSLVVFVSAFTFTLTVIARMSEVVTPVAGYIAAYSGLVSLGVFLFLIDHVCKALRPSGALWSVASATRRVIAGVYPQGLSEQSLTSPERHPVPEGEPTCTIPCRRDGVVLAFDIAGLVALARHADCLIEFVPQVGDFVARGDPLFRIYQGGKSLNTHALYQLVAVGQERTLEQDPSFGFRIIVDIASKALSPAINDPTTAVMALDQLHHLLRDVGSRHLADERARDSEGKLRLIYRTPDWNDFVQLAITEVRHFGGASIQVMRRLRALLENLIQTLPEPRAALLRQELQLLHRAAIHFFPDPEDQALAEVSDLQGVGGNKGLARSEGASLDRSQSLRR